VGRRNQVSATVTVIMDIREGTARADAAEAVGKVVAVGVRTAPRDAVGGACAEGEEGVALADA
jgi:hypothetical protein